MTANEAAAEISKLQAQSVAAEQQIAELKNSAASWRQSKSQCAGLPKKKSECQAGKETEAVNRLNQIPAQEAIISRNAELIAEYRKLIDAEAQSTIKLADHGLSAQSAIIKADGEAKAVQTAAKITADAQAMAIKTAADAEAQATAKSTDSNNQQKYIIVIAVVLVIVVVSALVAKKVLNKKNKKS